MADARLLPPEIEAKLKADHADKELHAVPVEQGVVVLRTPDRSICLHRDHLVQKARGPEERANAEDTFVRDCLIYPDAATLDGWMQARPYLSSWLSTRLITWATGAAEADEQKL